MKKAIAIVLVLIMCFGMCACGTEQTVRPTMAPQTVVLTTDNFYQYFDVKYSIDVSDCDDVFRNGYLRGFVGIATATVEIVPKFAGTWSDFGADISWSVYDNRWGFWDKCPYESKCTIEQPNAEDGERVETIVCTENYKSGEVPTSALDPLFDSPPRMSIPTVENVTGIIVVESLED